MKRKIRFLSAMILFIFPSLVFPIAIHAGWVDDWLEQKTVSSPSAVYGQERDYFSAGSFSARWRTGIDYPITVEPPRMKLGCGGIDIFLGGLSFLNFDYLVSKLQRIMQTAPAFAFDIALKAICPSCSETLSKLENFVNALNHLQMGECAASKALVTTISSAAGVSGATQSEMAKATNEFMTGSGLQNLYTAGNQLIQSLNGAAPANADKQALIAGCSAGIVNLFRNGSLMANVASDNGYSSTDIVDMIRGRFGDVLLTYNQNNGIQSTYIPPCSENSEISMDDFLDGKVYVRTADNPDSCQLQTDANASIRQYVNNYFNKLVASLQTRTALDSDTQSFVQGIPFSSYMIAKTAVETGQTGLIMGTLSELTAEATVSKLLIDLMSKSKRLTEAINVKYRNQAEGTSNGNPPTNCQLAVFANLMDYMGDVDSKIKKALDQLNSAYAASLGQLNNNLGFVEKISIFPHAGASGSEQARIACQRCGAPEVRRRCSTWSITLTGGSSRLRMH